MLSLAAVSWWLSVLPATFNTTRHASDEWIVHDIVDFVSALDLVVNAGLEILYAHLA